MNIGFFYIRYNLELRIMVGDFSIYMNFGFVLERFFFFIYFERSRVKVFLWRWKRVGMLGVCSLFVFFMAGFVLFVSCGFSFVTNFRSIFMDYSISIIKGVFFSIGVVGTCVLI